MRVQDDMMEKVKEETDVNYKEASQMFEDKEKKEEIAKGEIQRNLSSQKQSLKLRLMQRKKNLELKRSGFFDEEEGSIMPSR